MTLEEYANKVKGLPCRWCGTKLPERVDAYPHEGGRYVEGYPIPQWLSVHCPRCEYDWAFWKLEAQLARIDRRGGETS